MLDASHCFKSAILLIVFGLACLIVSSSHEIVEGREVSASTAHVLPIPNITQLAQTEQTGGASGGATIVIDLLFWTDEPCRETPIYRVYKRGHPVTVTPDLQWFIRDLAEANNVCERLIFGLILKESTFDANTVGDRGRSIGLGQIQRFWITGANIERLDDNWRERDLFCPYDNLTTMMELWNHARQRYNLDFDTDIGITRFVFWYMTGRDPSNVTSWAPADQVRRYAAELVYYGQ